MTSKESTKPKIERPPYRVLGTALDRDLRTTTAGLRVELWEPKADEPLVVGTTEPNGDFVLEMDAGEFETRFGRRRPRFELRVFHEDIELVDPRYAPQFTLQVDPARILVPIDLVAVVRGSFWEKLDRPFLLPTTPDAEGHGFEVEVVENPFAAQTLGALGFAVDVSGHGELPEDWALIIPYKDEQTAGIHTRSIRLFAPGPLGILEPLWNSSVNPEGKFIWANIRKPGIYVPIGKPRDLVVLGMIENLARTRRRLGIGINGAELGEELTKRAFASLREIDLEHLEEVRFRLTNFELGTRAAPIDAADVRIGEDGVIKPFPLPGGVDIGEFYEQIDRLDIAPTGLPEEHLFFQPDPIEFVDLPWDINPGPITHLPLPKPAPDTPFPIPWPPDTISTPYIPRWPLEPLFDWPILLWPWCRGKDWYMYHHDSALSGLARCSSIRSTNVASLQSTTTTPLTLDGPILSIPSIVGGKVYVGTARSDTYSTRSGTVYKIDLATGAIEAQFPLPTFHATRPTESPLEGARQWSLTGVGSSPAVVGGKVYVSTLTGFLYCLDANTLACLWYTDLRKRHLSKNQPINHAVWANGWSSPLVVNGKVYVGFGEGESNTWGFVYCLDASNGRVTWLFCTNKFTNPENSGTENQPNVLPPSLAPSSPPAGFTVAANDPPNRGASPWSHASYDYALDRIYIGTGNSIGDGVLPEPRYSNGVLSLDADTGQFRGFFQPPRASNYRPTGNENDIDVPAGPTLFTRGGQRFLGIGSKNGSFFILNPATMAAVTRQQMLPYQSDGSPFTAVDQISPTENRSGVMATAAVNPDEQKLFVPVGGYATSESIDRTTTPFMRAVNWQTLADAWPTTGVNPPKYSNVGATMYTRSGESGMASPATVNDVVFMNTTSSGLYAYRATDGLHLRTLVTAGSAANVGSMGPAIWGEYLVAGFWSGQLRIFKLQP